ncbi:MAG: signal peptidase I, partial [Clostridia bacterium]|nr:signal peptidase I [Clostridia bacterium]
LVKRIIATEGDTVEILPDGTVLVNDEPIPEDYIKDEPYNKSAMPRVTVPRDMVFVLGDNRNNSSDSRTFYPSMFVREDAILGKAVLRFYPSFEKIEHSKN